MIKAKKHLDQSFKAEDRTVEQEQRLENLNKQTELWLKYTSQEIIELYRKKEYRTCHLSGDRGKAMPLYKVCNISGRYGI